MAKKSFSISQSIVEGLTNTVKTVSNHKGELNYEMMSINLIEPDPENPRKLNLTLDDLQLAAMNADLLPADKKKQFESLRPLIDSINKVGVRNAIEVYKHNNKYRLISGERRWLASLAAQHDYIPAHICDKPDSFDLCYLQWIENMQREDLSLWEKYVNLKQIVDAYLVKNRQMKEITVDELSKILGTAQRQSYRYLTLLQAEANVLAAAQEGKIKNLKLLEEIVKLKDAKIRQEVLDKLNNTANTGIVQQVKKAKITQTKTKTHKQGRPAKKIHLGYLDNVVTARTIFNMLLEQEKLIPFHHLFQEIDWSSAKNISSAFKKLFGLIEEKIVLSK